LAQTDEKVFFDAVYQYLKDFKKIKINANEFDQIPKDILVEGLKEFSENKGRNWDSMFMIVEDRFETLKNWLIEQDLFDQKLKTTQQSIFDIEDMGSYVSTYKNMFSEKDYTFAKKAGNGTVEDQDIKAKNNAIKVFDIIQDYIKAYKLLVDFKRYEDVLNKFISLNAKKNDPTYKPSP